MSKSLEDVRWVRLYSPLGIPRRLIEQVTHRDYDVDDFLKLQEHACTVNGKDGISLNPFNHLYALVSEENEVVGYLWFVIDHLSKDMIINTYSVDKEYWGGGRAVKKLHDHLEFLMENLKIDKCYWITRYPKHSQRYGFKPSKNVLMEYSLVKEEPKKEDDKAEELEVSDG